MLQILDFLGKVVKISKINLILRVHNLEPYFSWRNLYSSEDDPRSPFYGNEHNEFYFMEKIYDHYIHPQWDSMGSSTLFLKILFVDYDDGYAFIELIGEWNDILYNDIMFLKREIGDRLISDGIDKFILIGENVLNFHAGDDCYYEEWLEDIENGWVVLLNFREHVLSEFRQANLANYFTLWDEFNDLSWRTYRPLQLFQKIQQYVLKRVSA